jgi:hypothetical protein
MRLVGILATIVFGLGVAAAVGMAVMSLPELKRYLKMESM